MSKWKKILLIILRILASLKLSSLVPSVQGEGRQQDGERSAQSSTLGGNEGGRAYEECKKTCKRNFWTQILNAVVKISTIVLAAFGIGSFTTED